jgi:DNA primase
VVEDIVSALRVNPYFDSVALLGTTLNAEKQREIRSLRYKNIFMCLDKDATKVSARYVKNTGINIPGLKVKFLDKDIKNMDEDELQTFVGCIESKISNENSAVV